MFNLIKKHFVVPACVAVGIILLASVIPVLRPVTLGILKVPLIIGGIVGRELGGIVFYHRNMVENEKLERNNNLLHFKINSLVELALENARLTRMLGLQRKVSFNVLACRVIARAADSWSSVIIIDRGSSSGIRRGQVVLNYFGLIGRVVETSAATAKVMLINDPNLGVSAIVQRSRQEGLVSGTLGNSLTMRYLPKGADIKPGDAIITSGLTDTCPKGLAIGEVTDVGEEFSGLSRYAIIMPACNLSNVEEVLVIIP